MSGLFAIGLKKPKEEEQKKTEQSIYYLDSDGKVVNLGTGYAQQTADELEKLMKERKKLLDEIK